MNISTVHLPSIPFPVPGHGTVLLIWEMPCAQFRWFSPQFLSPGVGEPGLANESTTPPYSRDWKHESSGASKDRTFPGTTGNEVLSSWRYLLNWQNKSLEL